MSQVAIVPKAIEANAAVKPSSRHAAARVTRHPAEPGGDDRRNRHGQRHQRREGKARHATILQFASVVCVVHSKDPADKNFLIENPSDPPESTVKLIEKDAFSSLNTQRFNCLT
jgi:hypothetical protein